MLRKLIVSASLLLSLSSVVPADNTVEKERGKRSYLVDVQKNQYTVDIHHPTHAICHIQIIAKSKDGNPLPLDPNQFEMMNQSTNEKLPFLKNLYGIETNAGSEWEYVSQFQFRVTEARKIGR